MEPQFHDGDRVLVEHCVDLRNGDIGIFYVPGMGGVIKQKAYDRLHSINPDYFEWEHLINAATGKAKTGDKYMIQPKGSAVTWLAGLYRIEDISGIQVPVFTVLTREPSEEIRYIHDRMPAILPGVDIEKWINPDSKPDEIIKNAITDMVFEKIIA